MKADILKQLNAAWTIHAIDLRESFNQETKDNLVKWAKDIASDYPEDLEQFLYDVDRIDYNLPHVSEVKIKFKSIMDELASKPCDSLTDEEMQIRIFGTEENKTYDWNSRDCANFTTLLFMEKESTVEKIEWFCKVAKKHSVVVSKIDNVDQPNLPDDFGAYYMRLWLEVENEIVTKVTNG